MALNNQKSLEILEEKNIKNMRCSGKVLGGRNIFCLLFWRHRKASLMRLGFMKLQLGEW